MSALVFGRNVTCWSCDGIRWRHCGCGRRLVQADLIAPPQLLLVWDGLARHRPRRGPDVVGTAQPGRLKSDDGWPAPQVAEAVDVALGTVYRVKQRFTQEGLDGVLKDRTQANRRRKLDDRGEAHLIALACSPPPAGHDHWTLRLLVGKVVELKLASSMSHEVVRKRLKKNDLKPWQKKEWCIPKMSAEFVANMEDLLDLYAEPYDPRRPVVCFDETSTQLLAQTRPSLPPRPGIPLRQD